ncbi:MAG: hypothetical protein KGY80_11720 [Candidatus Thorarchaeota archaeon]|nr:hypothetical protein [Candidatus Thorarchaeota archaeon]
MQGDIRENQTHEVHKVRWTPRALGFYIGGSAILGALLGTLYTIIIVYGNLSPRVDLVSNIAFYLLLSPAISVFLIAIHELIKERDNTFFRGVGILLGLAAIAFPISPLLWIPQQGGGCSFIFGYESAIWPFLLVLGALLAPIMGLETRIIEGISITREVTITLAGFIAVVLSIIGLVAVLLLPPQGFLDVYGTPLTYIVHFGGLVFVLESVNMYLLNYKIPS